MIKLAIAIILSKVMPLLAEDRIVLVANTLSLAIPGYLADARHISAEGHQADVDSSSA